MRLFEAGWFGARANGKGIRTRSNEGGGAEIFDSRGYAAPAALAPLPITAEQELFGRIAVSELHRPRLFSSGAGYTFELRRHGCAGKLQSVRCNSLRVDEVPHCAYVVRDLFLALVRVLIVT